MWDLLYSFEFRTVQIWSNINTDIVKIDRKFFWYNLHNWKLLRIYLIEEFINLFNTFHKALTADTEAGGNEKFPSPTITFSRNTVKNEPYDKSKQFVLISISNSSSWIRAFFRPIVMAYIQIKLIIFLF